MKGYRFYVNGYEVLMLLERVIARAEGLSSGMCEEDVRHDRGAGVAI